MSLNPQNVLSWLATRLTDYERWLTAFMPESMPGNWALAVIAGGSLFLLGSSMRLRRLLSEDESIPSGSVRFLGRSLLLVLAVGWGWPVILLLGLAVTGWMFQSYWPSVLVWLIEYWSALDDAMLPGLAVGAGAGVTGYWGVGRFVEPWFSSLLHAGTKTASEASGKTDIRDLHKSRKATKPYNPRRYFNVRKGLFLGLDDAGKPVYMAWSELKETHAQVTAPSGRGKGVTLANYGSQAIRNGMGLIVFDPKSDKFMPTVLRQQCAEAGVAFHLVDLNRDIPQINPLAHLSSKDVEILLNAVFQLKDVGEAADHYRRGDRRGVAAVAAALGSTKSLPEMYAEAFDILGETKAEKAEGFLEKLEDAASVTSCQTRYGDDLLDVIQNGGCLYVIGETLSPGIVTAQRMLCLAALLLISRRSHAQERRHVSIILDEAKEWFTDVTVNALATVRDKDCNVLLAHQSLGDLKNVDKRLNPDAVYGAVVTNTLLKLVGYCSDADTADWASRLTGTVQVKKERREISRNTELAEHIEDVRSITDEERALIEPNEFKTLPKNAFAVIGNGPARIVHVSPIVMSPAELEVNPREPVSVSDPRSLELPEQPQRSRSADDPEDLI